MAESTTIRLRFDGTSHETVDAVPLAAGRFRLQESPLFASDAVHAGDLVAAERLPDGTHRFVRVIERAPFHHYAWVVPQGWLASPDRAAYVAAVEAAGGRWEEALGGVLLIHVPLGSSFDAAAELDRYLKSDWPEA